MTTPSPICHRRSLKTTWKRPESKVIPADVLSPGPDCRLCPRLAGLRKANREAYPDWHNAPVPSFGHIGSSLLIVGLAPGLRGANRTGRPFTGDFAGDLLYETLLGFSLASGTYGAKTDDGLELVDVRITNAVRCVPPENKVTGAEAAACRTFLGAEIGAMKNLKVVLALGTVAHGAVLAALSERKSGHPFAHGGMHRLGGDLGGDLGGGLVLADSYHCSRYNTNTGRLTEAMFHGVFEKILPILAAP
ncbi:MAG: uracil-DNA glycosylase [Rhodospirillales bacterium]